MLAVLICFYLYVAFIMKCVEHMLKAQLKIDLYFGFKPFIKWFNLDRLTDGNACLA